MNTERRLKVSNAIVMNPAGRTCGSCGGLNLANSVL